MTTGEVAVAIIVWTLFTTATLVLYFLTSRAL